jgi:hypothetical protein
MRQPIELLRRFRSALPRLPWTRGLLALLLVAAALTQGLMSLASGAIVIGNQAGNYDYNTTSITWSHTVGAGNDRILVVRVSNINATVSVSSVTYGGTALTSLASATSGAGATNARASIWYLVAPPVGTATVLVTLSAKTWAIGNSDNYSGVSQYAPFGPTASATGSSTAPAVTVTSATGDLVLDAGAAQGAAGAAAGGAGQTISSAGTGSATTDVLVFFSTKAGAASSTPMSWTLTSSSPWVDLGVAMKPSYSVSGTVFEDVNYGGGAGRNLATSSGAGLTGATVELYSSTGSYLASTTTASGGGYTFTGLSGTGSYFVRVVNASVDSQRSGSTAALTGVQTYRSNASSGSAVDVTDQVGGTNPALADPGAASSGAAFNTGTYVFSAGLTGTAQSVAPLTLSGVNITGVDFGFNFDTVVNTNDTGQGSLRQAITNANALGGDASLAQSGRSAAIENLVFMISNGTAGSGLRSAYNYFTTSAGAYNVATISPASLLPTITSALVLDAQTQPGWSLAPLIELNGTNAGTTTTSNGLQPLASNCVIRGFVINRFKGEGIYSSTGNNLVLQGNYVGTNAAGTAASGNNRSGIYINTAASTGHQIGGTTAAQRNVLSGNTRSGLALSTTSSTLVQGNYIGVNASASGLLGNGQSGLDLGPTASGNTIGGTAAGAGNVIAGNTLNGVTVPTGATGNPIQGNSIYGNAGLGIDLDGDSAVNTNDGTKSSSKANFGMDYPVFTVASLSGTTLTVAGYVGSAAGQSTFANARVEVFVSDNDSSGYGQGLTYLGFLTADASGNFSGSFSGVSVVTAGTSKITGTATDGSGNTSEFGPNKVLGYVLSGTVFEDLNYGGGAGRNLAASGGAGSSGATVELYSSGGVWQSSTTTASGGSYSFTGLAAGSYYVRVANSSVLSTRSGSTSALRGVMTYRSTAASGSAVDVTDNVGGTNPALVDPGAGSSGATFSTSTFVFSAVLSGTAQSVTPVTISTSGAANLDFGFNFDTVVNTNDTGQGSLRQAITNANALGGDASLAQSGRSAAIENLVFMISNGTAGSGLRSTYNYFSTAAGSYNVATIAPASGFPALTSPLVIDAQTQPGWTLAPLLEVNAGNQNIVVFTFSGGNSVLRGFVINRVNTAGAATALRIDTLGGNTVQGNYLGLDAAGSTATANSGQTVNLYSGSNLIGGSTAAARNVISKAFSNGIVVWSGNANVIQGNYIGTNAAGTAALGSNDAGITFPSSSTAVGTVIGGVNAGEGNLISGNLGTTATTGGISIQGTGATGTLIRGNQFGLNAAGTGTIASGGYGIYTVASGTTVGGTASGAGNVITAYASKGVAVVGSAATGVAIEGNSIYGNTGIGIDLANDGITANDGAKTASQPNLLMDAPVFTTAALNGSVLTVAGYVGSAAGQSTFASARVEVFVSDATGTNGQGKTYLGFVTADASGNFSGTVSGAGGLTAGTSKITGTATDGSGNTSEFGVNKVVSYTLAGTVFEDINYGGGAGRSLAASGGAGVSGATVELYSSGGVWQSSTTTASGGGYSFTGLVAGSYYVRVVGSSVQSTRSGSTSALLGVMTYRTTAASGSAVDVTDNVGGTNPAAAGPGAGSSGATFNTSTFVFSAVLSGTAQAVTPVTLSTGGAAGLDFGFNFDTVVNTNATGQGSLYQAITNANTLTGDNTLAQSGRTAGIENLVFMVSNGTTGSGGVLALSGGLRSGYNYFSAGVATIAMDRTLPDVTAPLVIDAWAQPGWTAAPVIELNGAGAGASVSGLTIKGGASTVRGLVINRYTANGLQLMTLGSNTVAGCYLGTNAAGASASANAGIGLNVFNSGSNTIGGTATSAGNLISGNTGTGLTITGTGTGNLVQGNTIGLNAAGTTRVANGANGIYLNSASNTIGGLTSAARNVVAGNTVQNLTIDAAASGTVVQGNYFGTTASGTAGPVNGYDNILVNASSAQIGGTANGAGNTIAYAAGAGGGRGVTVTGAYTGNAIQGNSIFGNATIGIDLAGDGVTTNDGAKTANQPNLLMDYPVFTSASLSGTTLTVAGYVGSAAGQSTFASARVEVFLSDASNSNGQGKTYLGFLSTDASGNFSGTVSVNGVSGATAGSSSITGTATDGSNNTSEFGPNKVLGYTLAGTVFEDLNYGGGAGRSLATSGGAGSNGATVELYNSAGVWQTSTTTASGGSYSFTGLAAGNFYVRVVNNSVLSTRSGSSSSLRGVLTYRTDASSGSAVAVTDAVGGTNPAQVGPGAGSSGATFNTSTFVFSAGLSGTAQAVTPVTVGTAPISGLDFGFNFDTVVNTNDSGAGSLRQAITNANTLAGDASLAQSGRTAGIENLVFMISNGSAGSGLRSAYNYFSGGVATITPTSALPDVSTAMVIDAQTQPGWTANPVIDVSGASAGTANGFVLTGGGTTLRGLVIRNFGSANGGVYITSGNGNTVQGCWIGLTAAGTAASGNLYGVYVASASNLIGGTTAAQRNVVSGNAASGVVIYTGADSNAIKGNYIGLNAAGTAAVGNLADGIVIFGTNTTVGGVNTGEGNVIAGNNTANSATYGGVETVGSGTAVIRGNLFGLKADGSAVIASNGAAVIIGSPNNTVGGTAAGAGNTVTGSSRGGVVIKGSTTNGVKVSGNSIYGNAGPGIDLGDDGVTANDGAKTAGQPNLLMDTPVLTTTGGSGSTLTVAGYVGSAAGQSTFASAQVEVFVADPAATNPQGKTYLGTVIADASGNFSGSITVPGGVTLTPGSSKLTATATDGSGNTSEFGPTFTLGLGISGTVFEDANYGGGAGRSLAGSGGSGVSGATVELYNGAGVWQASATTSASGGYSFLGLTAGSYYLRVVGSSVLSTRSGSAAGLVGVMTFRSNASSGTAVAVTDNVGGTNPALVDPGSAGSGASLNTATGVFSAGLSGTAQSLAPVTLSSGSVAGVDFGFNFDTVVNTNDTGQGSLRQAITNANTLGGDASLAQSGRTATIENLVFMISNGSAGAGLRSAYNYFSGGVAPIAPATSLPPVTAPLVIDGQTQPGWTANPVIDLDGSAISGGGYGLYISGGGSTVRGLVVRKFHRGIFLINGGGNTVQGCWVGTTTAGSAASPNVYGVYVDTSAANLIGGTTAMQRNVVAGNSSSGIVVWGTSDSNIVKGNYIGLNAAGTAAVGNGDSGIIIFGSNTTVGGLNAGEGNVVAGNLASAGQTSAGISTVGNGTVIRGNRLGTNAAGTVAIASGGPGIYARGTNVTIGGTAAGAGNVITGHASVGVAVDGSGSSVLISGNSIYGNTGIGIDLGIDGITVNDGAKSAGLPNLLMDYPVFTSASVSGTTLTVAGYVGSAASQSTFAGARVEVFISDGSGANGQGKTYLGSLTADASGNFSGTIANALGLSNGSTALTGTATDGDNNTSEFGPNVTLGLAITGTVFEDQNYGGGAGRSLAASGGTGVGGATVELYDNSGSYLASTTTASGGSYSFAGLTAGTYHLRVVSNSVLSQRSGAVAGLLPVLTYRTTATSGTAVAVTDFVGGTNPAFADPGAASAGATFSTATYAYSSGLAGTAHAVAPVTVGSASITSVDFGFNFDTVSNTNASGPGSLAQVLTNANALGGDASLAQSGRTAAVENVVFMIPNGTAGSGLRSAFNYFTAGVATISPLAALPTVTSALVIDAQTQPGWTANPVVELNGAGAGSSNGLNLAAAGSTLRGLIINRYSGSGLALAASATVQGNWLGVGSSGNTASANLSHGISVSGGTATLGGTAAGQGNVVSGNGGAGIWLAGGSNHLVLGNRVGVGADGNTRVGNSGYYGIEVASGVNGSTIGGTATGAGNVISGQTGSGQGGLRLCGNSSTVQGNFIGTNAAGTAAVANASHGIAVCSGSVGTVIGGTSAAAANVVSGNGGHGISAAGPATVQGNTIGSNAAGSAAVANTGNGIDISVAAASGSVQVGGTAAGAGNLVSGNTGRGVAVQAGSAGNAILGNRLYGNGIIAIDLNANGVSANDGAKTAGAGNLLMDSPVFTSARATGSQLVVAGYVGSAAGQSTFANSRVEIYASDNDATGYGGGKTYLGALTADGSGNFSGTLTMPVTALAIGSKLTGTATDTTSNTSEFGANFNGLIVDLVVNDNGDAADASPGDGLCATAGGVCTLRAALAELNAWANLATPPTIAFALPGCSSYGAAACTITPASALPSVTRTVLIDGSTQPGFSTSSYSPIVEISGASAPGGTTGLVVSASNSTVRGLAINRYPGNGITLSGNGNTLVGLRIGLATSAATAAANGGAGAYITGTGSIIGGAAAADGNVIAGNTGAGITVGAGSTTVTGNLIGTDASGTGGLGNGGSGVAVLSAGLTGITISGNTVTNNGAAGVGVAAGGAAQVLISANAISGNGGLGIDLGNDGVTANTGVTDSAKPNNGMNEPVITGAGVSGNTVTVSGYIGIGTGQATFAGARVEFFKAAPDSSGYGEGQVYLGFLTADANGRFSGTVAYTAGALNVGDTVTATATDAAGNTSEFGPNWTSTSLAALTPANFNAFDAGTAAGALTGPITSKVAGSPASFAVIALDSSGTALHPGFTGTVNLSWVDARDDSGALSGSCRASWVDKGSAGSATFSNNSRLTVALTPPASGTRIMRLKISYTSGGSTVTACSNDAFADLPASYSWTGASDADSSTAGTTRALDNTGANGGVVHRAGRPFTVRARALDATGALMTGYDGSPVLAAAGCLLPGGCTAATLTAPSTAAAAGAYTNSLVSYAEVGALQVQLTDASYADVDAGDTAIGVRTLTSSLLAVGRFIPDSLSVVVTTNGQLATANAACLASGAGATFIGQAFGWNTAPQVTVTALNAAGATTTRWTGSLMKLAAGSGLSEVLTASSTGGATFSASYGSVTVTDLGAGQARITASSTDRYLLDLASGSVQDTATPAFAWSLALSDASEAAVAGNPTLTAAANQGSVAFNSGGTFYSGRLTLSPGYGDVRSGVRLLAQLQRYTAAGWVTMTEDQGCVTIQNQNVAVESPTGVFATLGSCVAPMASSVTTRGGRAWLALPGTPAGAPGRLTLRLAGAAATGSSCTTAGAPAALVPLAQNWLLGGSSSTGPQALATWGKPQRDAVLRRETW